MPEQEVGVKGSLDGKFWSDELYKSFSKPNPEPMLPASDPLKKLKATIMPWLSLSDTLDLGGFQVNSPTANPISSSRITDLSRSHRKQEVDSLPETTENVAWGPCLRAFYFSGDQQEKLRLKKVEELLDTAGQEDWDSEGALTLETVAHTNQQKLRLKQEVEDLLDIAGQEDWDGEGADALAPETVGHAKELVDTFPQVVSRIPDPDVSATPQGEIDFEWVLSKNVMLTIGVCPSGEIAFANACNGTRLSGKGPWAGSLRTSITACLQDLCREQTPTTHN